MIVSAHQPHYLPWIGYLNKIHLSDVFMIMDNMNYTNNGFINKNRIMSTRGVQFINVPLIKPYGLNTKINQLLIETRTRANWNKKHLRTIKHNYESGKGFNDFFPIIEPILEKKYELHIDLLTSLLESILTYLEIDTKIIFASNLNTTGKKETELITNIIKDSGCNEMLLGMGASVKYVNYEYVHKSGYNLLIQKLEHPIYTQKSRSFTPGISIIDLIFNVEKQTAIQLTKNCGNFIKV